VRARAGHATVTAARKTARREAGNALGLSADAARHARDWVRRHLPWRQRTALARLRQRLAEVAHRA
jgi:hypothetical protein